MTADARRFRGSIDAIALPALLVRCARRLARGVLTIRSADVDRRIFLRDGRISHAVSSDPGQFLAERARRKGLVTGEQIRTALAAMEAGDRIGTVLVRQGVLTEPALVELLLSGFRDIVGEAFDLVDGSYELAPTEADAVEPIVLDEAVPAVIVREVRRRHDLERARQAAGTGDTLYYPVRGHRERFAESGLESDGALAELAQLIGNDPGISVRNLVVSMPRPEIEILSSLWILRALEVVGIPPEPKPTIAPPVQAPAPATGNQFADLDPETELDLDGLFPNPAKPAPSEPMAARLGNALAAAEEEVDVVLALGVEFAATSGRLSGQPFVDVLRALARQRATGTLILKHDEVEKTVTLDRGRPIFATTNLPAERLTDRLVSEGHLEAADVLRVQEFWPSARRVGGILLALRLVAPEVLRDAVRRQVVDIVASLYTWTEGGFYFLERDDPPPEDVILDLSLPDLALRGAQKIGRADRLIELMGGEGARLYSSEDPALLFQALTLGQEQREFLGRVGDGATIAELVTRGPVPRSAAIFLLFTGYASGFLELRDRPRIAGLSRASRQPTDGSLLHPSGRDAAERELVHRWDEIRIADDYGVLGLLHGAGEGDVVAAFERIAPAFHPDRYRMYGDASILRLAGRVFDRHVLAFYRILNPAGARPASETPGGVVEAD